MSPVAPTKLASFKQELDLDEAILQLLLQRGIDTFEAARDFFKPSLAQLHNPYLMQDMEAAVVRIDNAKQKGEKIMIYGDYDVDGTTSVALMANFLAPHYPNFITYIPDRYKEGYGVSIQGIDQAYAEGVGLIIALDCGIKAIKQVNYALEKGIDFIICDHHTPGPELPPAAAILDPKRKDCAYPYKGLSGCGVGFKLCQALCQKWNLSEDELWRQLDLLALSIGADIVPMTGENRILAHFGLEKINSKPSDGIQALLASSQSLNRRLSIGDVVFILAPRINAAGRLAHAREAVDLLRGRDLSLLPEIAAAIEAHNKERKELDKKITKEALGQIEDQIPEDAYSCVVFDASWHKGVIGIVASRLIENHYRPTIVLTQSGEHLAGSARSVDGFDLYQALEACEAEMIQFGGHAAAAGMTLKPEKLSDFKQAFEAAVRQQILPEQRIPRLYYDLELKAEDIDPKLYRMIQRFAPFGPENLAPNFLIRGLVNQASRTVGEDHKHLKFNLVDPESGVCLEGIGFNLGNKLNQVTSGAELALIFHLELNVFRGQTSLQMRVLDVKLNEELEEGND